MKKLRFIAVVTVAITTLYVLFNRKINSKTEANLSAPTGSWRIDSIAFHPSKDSTALFILGLLPMIDSNIMEYQYQFGERNDMYRLLHQKIVDTIPYSWNKNVLLMKEKHQDTAVFQVLLKDATTIVFQAEDSTLLYFKKVITIP